MDTRLKNNRRVRISAVIVGLILFVIASICFFPGISRRAENDMEQRKEIAAENPEMDTDLLSRIYEGCYVLYFEMEQRQGAHLPSEIYLELSDGRQGEEERLLSEELRDRIDETIGNLAHNFERYRSEIDYAIFIGNEQYEKNTDQLLEQVISGTLSTEGERALEEYYSNYFIMEFDENGILHLGTIYSDNVSGDTLIKSFGQIDRENPVWGNVEEEYRDRGLRSTLGKPEDFTVVFGIPRTGRYPIVVDQYGEGEDVHYGITLESYYAAGAGILYLGMLALITGLMFVVTSRRVWKAEIPMHRPRKWYLMEAAVTGVIIVLSLSDSFVLIVYHMNCIMDFSNLWSGLMNAGASEVWRNLLEQAFFIFLIYGGWYLSVRFIRPVFTLGVGEYIRQCSLIYQIFPLLKRLWKKCMGVWNCFVDEVGHIDFGQKSVKTMGKLVAVNFIVLSVVSCLWFFGIGVLLFYSVALFFFLKKYYDRVGRDYQTLLRGVNQIAEGNLDTEITEDIGMFEPFKDELAKIRTGLKTAVSQEVKSQRMKTELITNVSHDLKTPLTAITTYVELLKKEDITEEERRSYIDTLEKKSLRLKVLIEDLFEVSKATSNNITLNPIEMDVVNLMKQVAIEHTDAYQTAGLDLRWRVPKERITLMLDNQKTYRIFENLFVNVQKYAMPGSRVYVDVELLPEDTVRITMRNMSREELNFRADEITERFVRGDVSRNTEGSGLGLAIAKSFAEAQGGKFAIEVDGDLFKAVLLFTLWKSDKK